MRAKIYLLILLFSPGFSNVFGQGMIIEPNAYVTVAGGAKLIISDATDGLLTIKSTAAGTGSLVVDGTAGSTVSVAAHSNVELYLTGGVTGATDLWHLVSSPISNGVSGTFLADYLLSYDETTNLFTYIVPVDVPLVPMKGYEAWAWVPSGKTDVFSGTLNNGSQSSSLTRTFVPSLSDDNGWNLLGNPYPCAIDIDAVTGWDFGVTEQKVWIWNTSGPFKGSFATHVRGGSDANGGSRYIPAEQGFFLHVPSPNVSSTVTMDNNVRVHSNQPYYKSVTADSLTNSLHLVASGNNYNHETVIYFTPDAQSQYDNYDALYYSGSADAPRIYSVIDNDINVCINALPGITDNLTVPVGFRVGVPGNYTITANGLNTFDGSVIITLFDQKTGISQKLNNNPVYAFTADTVDNANRFLIIFGLVPFGTNNILSGENVQIYSFGDDVFIKTNDNAITSENVFIYDPIGKQIFSGEISGAELTKISPNLSTGYYVVKVVTNESVYSKKIFITR